MRVAISQQNDDGVDNCGPETQTGIDEPVWKGNNRVIQHLMKTVLLRGWKLEDYTSCNAAGAGSWGENIFSTMSTSKESDAALVFQK